MIPTRPESLPALSGICSKYLAAAAAGYDGKSREAYRAHTIADHDEKDTVLHLRNFVFLCAFFFEKREKKNHTMGTP